MYVNLEKKYPSFFKLYTERILQGGDKSHLEEPQRTWVNLFLLNVTLSRFFEDKGYKIINGSLHHKSQSPSASKSKSSSTSSSTSTSSSIHSAVKSLKQNIKNIDTSLGSLKSKIKKLKKKK